MRNTKKLLTLLLCLLLVLTACGKAPAGEKTAATTVAPAAETQAGTEAKQTGTPVELNVYAAASLTEAMENAKKLYTEKHPEVKINFNFDSSGTLKTQIEQGAPCDIFVSAAQKQMNALDITSDKNEGKLDFIDPESRRDVLENQVVLAVPAGNPAQVKDFTDITKDEVKKIALGNSDVPVGKYSEELYRNLGLWDEIQDKISWGSNVKEVTTWVAEGAVDCGVVYATDAYSAKNVEVVNTATKEMIKTPVIYPAALLKNSNNKEAAADFLNFAFTDKDSVAFFEQVGFKVVH